MNATLENLVQSIVSDEALIGALNTYKGMASQQKFSPEITLATDSATQSASHQTVNVSQAPARPMLIIKSTTPLLATPVPIGRQLSTLAAGARIYLAGKTTNAYGNWYFAETESLHGWIRESDAAAQ